MALNSLRSRRARWGALLILIAVVAVACAVYYAHVTLRNDSLVSGWTLAAAVLLLSLLGIRKRLPMLPLLPTSFWVRMHIVIGVFSLFTYLLHVPTVVANGWFELSLSLLFLSVSASGVYGYYLARTIPRKLTAIPGEYRYDQLNWQRSMVAEVVSEVIDDLPSAGDETVLTRFYGSHLQHYFGSDVGLRFLLFPSGGQRRRMLAELGELNRYLSPEMRVHAGKLAALIRTRDDLDFHHALQMRLRVWLTIHAGLTASLLLLIVVHMLLVLQFKGV